MHNLIGLAGLKRSGKDTAALALIADGYTKMAFADSLRRSMEILNPFIGTETGETVAVDANGHHPSSRMVRVSEALETHGGWEGLKTSPFAAETRRMLQVMGTEVGREHLDPDVWVNAVFFARETFGLDKLVVPDVRFINEADRIHREGGIVVLVERDGTDTTDLHPSEVIDFPVDHVISNNGTVEDLHAAIRAIAQGK